MKDNEAIAQNGKLICKTHHIKQHFHHVHQDQQDCTHQLYWNLVRHNLLKSLNKNNRTIKHKSHPKLIFTLTRSSVHFPFTCYNLPTNQWRSDSRGVTDIQSCYVSILHITYSALYPCPSNQCNTARLESKLTPIPIMLILSDEIER